ncbi:MAG: methyltransferase domain-containing protein [Saprospiraceae bacterium]|nr:methyltransferase domain-containing protein [Saprospiraceae bacterium]
MGAIKFFIEGVRRFKEVGTFARSSKFVGKTMVKRIDFSTAKCIVELGAGDGPVTKQILKNMGEDTQLFLFEINEKLCEDLHQKFDNDPRIHIIQDDAKKAGEYINKAGFDYADAILSEIPFVIIPEDDIIEAAAEILRPGGYYSQLHYSLIAKKRYKRIFGNVDVEFVPVNVPPAFIHFCQKREEA